jgi:hypothetical protein
MGLSLLIFLAGYGIYFALTEFRGDPEFDNEEL